MPTEISINGKGLIKKIDTTDAQYSTYIPDNGELVLVTSTDSNVITYKVCVGDGTSTVSECAKLFAATSTYDSRLGLIDFSSQNWQYDTTGEYFYLVLTTKQWDEITRAGVSKVGENTFMVPVKYTFYWKQSDFHPEDIDNNKFAVRDNDYGKCLYVKDTDYSTTEDFKTGNQKTYFYYYR